MNVPFAFYYKMVWCDAFRCHYPTIQYQSFAECYDYADTIARIFQATAWCTPVTLLAP